MAGFIALVKRVNSSSSCARGAYAQRHSCFRQESVNPTYLLSWIPESLLNGRADLNKFLRADKDAVSIDVEDEGRFIHGGVVPPSQA